MLQKIVITCLGVLLTFSSFALKTLHPVAYTNVFQDTILVEGKVLDSETKAPIKARISYERIPTRDDIDIIYSDSAAGTYQLRLKPESKYKVSIQAANYITAYQLLETVGTSGEPRDIYLVPLKVGQVIVMNSITFEKGRAKLLKESYGELDNVYKMLTENPRMAIQLEGHTDNAGSPKANLKLSEDRVNTVREYLVEKGIKKSRIEIKAFGGSKPIANNSLEDGRVKNRRVEIRILKN